MSSLIKKIRARVRGEDKYLYAIEDAPRDDICERWDAIRLARRRLFAPALFGSIGAAGLLGEVRDAGANTPFLTWAFKGTPVTGNSTEHYSPLSMRPQPSRIFDMAVLVNEFYPALLADAVTPFNPQPYSTVANRASNPLSTYYAANSGGVARAIADYPFLSAYGLNTGNVGAFEIDWCAWMAAFLYAYVRDGGTGAANIKGQGNYVTKHTIQCSCGAATIEGEGTQFFSTSITWIGANGTVDAPNYILLLSTQDPLGNVTPQPGSALVPVAAAIINTVRTLAFFGKNGNMHGLVGNESGYVSGINVSTFNGFTIERCHFHLTLWDGICVTGFGVWCFIRENMFEGCYRDCIQFTASGQRAGGTTTMTISNNVFNFSNRYHILLNMYTTSAGAHPLISNNIHEPWGTGTGAGASNFFTQNPQWFVHGVPAPVCLVNCQQAVFRDPYIEWSLQGMIALFHLVSCPAVEMAVQGGGSAGGPTVLTGHMNQPTAQMTCSGTTMTLTSVSGYFYPEMGVASGSLLPVGTKIVTAPAGNQAGVYTISSPGATIGSPVTVNGTTRTPDAIVYEAANGYWDVTDKRNLWAGSNSTGGNVVGSLSSSITYTGSAEFWVAGGAGVSGPMDFDLSGMGFALDLEVDPTTGKLAVAFCSGGSTSASGPTLTVAGTTINGKFKTGQYIILGGGGSLLAYDMYQTVLNNFQITSGGPGGAGTYGLNSNPDGGATAQPIWALAATKKKLTDIAPAASGVGFSAVPTTSSLTQIPTPASMQVYLKASQVVEFRHSSSDNSDEWLLFGQACFRPGLNNNYDGSGSSHASGYTGMFINAQYMSDFINTAPANYLDNPMFWANVYNQSGVFVRYVELAGGVFTNRKIRYNYASTLLPTSGNWQVGDIIFFNNPPASPTAGYIGAICTSIGPPVVWRSFGALA